MPVRIEIGPRDVQNNSVVLARRDRPGKEGKEFVSQDGLAIHLAAVFENIQSALYHKAAAFRADNTVDVSSERELAEVIGARKFARAYWGGDPEGEERIKQATGATTRCIPLDQVGIEGKSITTGKPTSQQAIFARAY